MSNQNPPSYGSENNGLEPLSYLFQTNKNITPITVSGVGLARMVGKNEFPVLEGVTCYAIEVWDESMRLPHWHPNASELGYVVSGEIEIILWRSPGETAVFRVSAGMCWFIPKGSLHSLNSTREEAAVLLVGFSTDNPQNVDLPVALNGIPVPIRQAYTAPHEVLQKWQGPITNPLVGRYTASPALSQIRTGSPYGFDLAKVTPLFQAPDLGSVVWGVKSNWGILEEISVLRAILKPGVARDPIWYPDAGTLYVVAQGQAEFHIIIPGYPPHPFVVEKNDFVFVPMGMLHTFCNRFSENFEVMAFFTKASPQPEVSLSIATSFFPNTIRKDALTRYGEENQSGDPLAHLRYHTVSPYLIPIETK